ncbi:hypothetical protein [Arthrobacter caoxuetaonis]|uniref:Uncharacterized protein n=1 Tax=Arthrobacter caoxuetaonis TaxID=2886935 RepID=A0A9X1SE26_9MICC|nr:hypothetical protein [Arthrobacter caoxuetaonis]MCC3299457.1 hypothetical protein [Arthrobacter caoxuetaonis]USQ59051.1 hypothetical protein NF551_18265 [Arthrobacter caoxuetaonis]
MSFSLKTLSPGWKKALGWVLAAAVSIAHIQILFRIQMPEDHFLWMYPLLLAVPAIVSTILLPGEIRHWYRWAAIIGLSFSVYVEALPLVLAIGGTYALHQAWAVERTLPVGDLIRFRRSPKLAEAAA